MAKRKGDPSHNTSVIRRRSGHDTGSLGFLNNNYLRQLYDQLHVNVLYSWLRDDLGPIDDPLITRDMLWNMWKDMNIHGFFTVAYITEYYVDKELNFWHEVIQSPNRVDFIWRLEHAQH